MNFAMASRVFGIVNAATGVVTASRPEWVAKTVRGSTGKPPDRRIVRVLGLRQALQGLATVAAPSPRLLTLGAAVDLSHAASMLPVAAIRPESRHAALISASLAATSAATAIVLLRARATLQLAPAP